MDFDAILKAGGAIGDPRKVEADGFAVVPDGYHVEDLERFLGAPRRMRGKVQVDDKDSFVGYFSRFASGRSTIFSDKQTPKVVGVLDHHDPNVQPDSAGFGDHSVTYAPSYSEEWGRWKASDGTRMKQVDFAFFIEENRADIIEPAAANMIEISRSLKAKKAVEFVSDQNLADGSVQFTYNETVSGTVSKGNIKVPEKFVIALPVFFNGPKYRVDCLLRYRIDGGNLAMWFDMHRAEYVEQDAFNEIVEAIAKECGDAPMFMGRA